MKSKSLVVLFCGLFLMWLFLFQGTQAVSSSPLLRITFTVSPTVTATSPAATLPPPPVLTNPPLIPVTGTESAEKTDLLIVGGMVLLVVGVVGLAWPEKRRSRAR